MLVLAVLLQLTPSPLLLLPLLPLLEPMAEEEEEEEERDRSWVCVWMFSCLSCSMHKWGRRVRW